MMESRILFYSDGTRTIDEISAKLLEHVKKGDLNANLDGKNMAISTYKGAVLTPPCPAFC